LAPGYGLTEAPCVTGLQDDDALTHSGSVGTAVAATELRVVGPDADSGIGQLLVRGPQLMSGYWGRPQASAEVLVDGWLHTGDIVRIDDGGRVFMLDRRTDLINRGGENVYSVEVEAAVAAYPAVGESAVVAVPDDRLGSRVGVCVVPRPGVTFEGHELVRVARDSLAPFKVPEFVCMRSEPLPRNPAGKVDKEAVRAQSQWTPLPR
jgi:acyl-CoA synthetase (AMP-forming)/AMP-acid ligase II